VHLYKPSRDVPLNDVHYPKWEESGYELKCKNINLRQVQINLWSHHLVHLARISAKKLPALCLLRNSVYICQNFCRPQQHLQQSDRGEQQWTPNWLRLAMYLACRSLNLSLAHIKGIINTAYTSRDSEWCLQAGSEAKNPKHVSLSLLCVCVSISGSMCECIYEPLYHAIPYYNIYTYVYIASRHCNTYACKLLLACIKWS